MVVMQAVARMAWRNGWRVNVRLRWEWWKHDTLDYAHNLTWCVTIYNQKCSAGGMTFQCGCTFPSIPLVVYDLQRDPMLQLETPCTGSSSAKFNHRFGTATFLVLCPMNYNYQIFVDIQYLKNPIHNIAIVHTSCIREDVFAKSNAYPGSCACFHKLCVSRGLISGFLRNGFYSWWSDGVLRWNWKNYYNLETDPWDDRCSCVEEGQTCIWLFLFRYQKWRQKRH